MGFEACHPAVNFIFFASVIYGAVTFKHPVFLLIAYLCAFAYSVKRCGKRAIILNLCLLPLILAFALYYSSYHHFGVTVLKKNFINNDITLESIVYGLVIGLRFATLCMWLEAMFRVVSSDKVVYLFGKISPLLSLFLTILLRLIPRISQEATRINLAQKGIGRGSNQGNIFQRLINCLRIFSMLITWMISALALESDSMRSRGSLLRGRTAFSIYRFDNRDRAFVIGLFFCVTLTAMGVILGATDMWYNPRILWNHLDGLEILTAIGYLALCSMPMGLELWTEYRFRAARKRGICHDQLDNEFFEEYKRLDRLCSDMYSCRDGIRQYLEDMECQFSEGEKTIPHWAQDYRKLRGLRRTRNTLAHNVSEYQVCTEQDVENVIDFVDRIMQQQDPLAMLNLYNSKDEESETMDESEVSVPDSFYYDAPRNEKKGKQLILGVVLLVITCVMVILVSILISHIV